MKTPSHAARMLLALVLVTLLLEPVLAQAPAPSLPSGRPRPSQEMIDLLDPIKRIISGPSWLVAHGVDPRPWAERPGWNTLNRQDLARAESPFSSEPSPLMQSIGPGVLVPFRSPAPAFSRNTLITRDFSDRTLQTEPHLAVNPRDPDHLVLGTIDYNFPNNSAYVSIDGGITWEGPKQVKYLRDDRVSGGDPVVTFDNAGNVYFASISIGVKEYTIGQAVGYAQVSSIQVSSSNDGGFTWNDPLSTARSRVATNNLSTDSTGRLRGEIRLSFLDKPWMTVGPHPIVEETEVIYVTYVEFDLKYQILYIGEVPTLGVPEMETTARMVRSEDRGRTWSAPVAVSPTVRRIYGEVANPVGIGPVVGTKRVIQGPVPIVDPKGQLYVFWLDSTDDESMKGLGEIQMARSEDAGATFSEPVRIASFLEPGFRPRNAFFRYWASAFPKAAMGPNGELYVVYTALPPEKLTDDGDIYLIQSTDGGNRWSRPQRINGDDTDRVQFFPDITVGPDGVVHVMWGDMRDDPMETRYHIYYTRSTDQGQSWGFELPDLGLQVPDTRVTDFPSNPNRGFPSGLFLGDYFAIAASETDVYLVWADTRLGEFGGVNQKIGFSRQRPIPAPEVFISPATGAGGETISVQGHNFQPDMDIFLQMGGNTVAAGRTDSNGRISTRVFVPISGEGAHPVQLVDSSGNFASTSFYMDFGFDNLRQMLSAQQEMQRQLEDLSHRLEQAPSTSGAAAPSLEERAQPVSAPQAAMMPVTHAVAATTPPLAAALVPHTGSAAPLAGLALGILLTALWTLSRRKDKDS